MVDRDTVMADIRRRIENQTEIVNKRPTDRKAFMHLEKCKRLLSELNKHVEEPEERYYVALNEDYRSRGNDHSEVSYTIIFICCKNCAKAIQSWKTTEHRSMAGRHSGIYYSFGSVKRNDKVTGVLGQKIVKYPARSLRESLDSDEQRISGGEWLEDDYNTLSNRGYF